MNSDLWGWRMVNRVESWQPPSSMQVTFAVWAWPQCSSYLPMWKKHGHRTATKSITIKTTDTTTYACFFTATYTQQCFHQKLKFFLCVFKSDLCSHGDGVKNVLCKNDWKWCSERARPAVGVVRRNVSNVWTLATVSVLDKYNTWSEPWRSDNKASTHVAWWSAVAALCLLLPPSERGMCSVCSENDAPWWKLYLFQNSFQKFADSGPRVSERCKHIKVSLFSIVFIVTWTSLNLRIPDKNVGQNWPVEPCLQFGLGTAVGKELLWAPQGVESLHNEEQKVVPHLVWGKEEVSLQPSDCF